MISIVPYKSTWPDEFAQTGKRLRAALGDLALRIDHIGSTSVPGLAAKDLIDIQITAQTLAPGIEEALWQVGFNRSEHYTSDHVPPGAVADPLEWTKWFFKPPSTQKAVHVHVRLQGRANQGYPLLFRDYLRAHPSTAEAYAQVKLALVAHAFHDQDAYYDVKDPVCDIIMAGAKAWASATGWNLGPSDC